MGNRVQYSGKYGNIIMAMKLSRMFLNILQQYSDIATYTKMAKQTYGTLMALMENMPFW